MLFSYRLQESIRQCCTTWTPSQTVGFWYHWKSVEMVQVLSFI